MRVSLLTYLFATAITTQGFAAEINDPSVSFQQLITGKCENSICSNLIKGNIAMSANVALTEPEVAGLNDTTTVTINIDGVVVPVRLSDDPNFENGDTSVNVVVHITIFSGLEADAKAQLNWQNGDLKIKLSIPFEATDIPFMTASKSILAKTPETKETAELDISAENSGGPVFADDRTLTGDSKESNKSTESAEGDETFKSKTTFKSRLLPAPV